MVSIIRAPEVQDVSLGDPSWSDVNGIIWSVVELNIGIVSACLPTMRPIFHCLLHTPRQIITQMKSSTHSHENHHIRLQDFNESSTQTHYGPSTDLQGLMNSNMSRRYERPWEVHSPQRACIRSESDPASVSDYNTPVEKFEPMPNAIRVTTEVDIRHTPDADRIHI